MNTVEAPLLTTAGPARGRKIVIAVHNGFSVRYMLQTDIFRELKRSGAELVILCQSDRELLRTYFGAPGVAVESIPAEIGQGFIKRNRLQRVLSAIRFFVLAGNVRTPESVYRAEALDARGRGGIKTYLVRAFLRGAILLARRSWLIRRAMLFLDSLLMPREYVDFLERVKPDLVVTTSLGTFNYDQYVMRAARRRGVPVLSVILSWDNTTTLGYPAAHVDHVIAWTEIMRRELVEYNDIPLSKISVGGVAHFDGYFRDDAGYDRAEVLKNLGCDPAKRTILVITRSPKNYAMNPNLAVILAKAIEEGGLPADTQILIRVHPLHYEFSDGVPIYGELLDLYRRLTLQYPFVVLNEPVIRSKKLTFDMGEGEIVLLGRILRATDVLVNSFSTLNIEGAIFDIPLVNACFEREPHLYPAKVNSRFDIMLDYHADHNNRIVNWGGSRVAFSPKEMIEAVRAYLADRSLDRAGRRRIVEAEVGPNHGRAGSALGAQIIDFLLRQPSPAGQRFDASPVGESRNRKLKWSR